MEHRTLPVREVISRALPYRDKRRAEALIALLDQCGYEIVPKMEDISEPLDQKAEQQH